MKNRKSSAFALASGAGLAGLHAAITLSYRWPMLAAFCMPGGQTRHGAEVDRMLSEKTSATVEGIFGAQKEMIRLAAAAMTGRLDFSAMPEAAASIASAGLRPAFRAVKANSRRLNRR